MDGNANRVLCSRSGFGSTESEFLRRHHRREWADNQCSSVLIEHIKAPIHLVISLSVYICIYPRPHRHPPQCLSAYARSSLYLFPRSWTLEFAYFSFYFEYLWVFLLMDIGLIYVGSWLWDVSRNGNKSGWCHCLSFYRASFALGPLCGFCWRIIVHVNISIGFKLCILWISSGCTQLNAWCFTCSSV